IEGGREAEFRATGQVLVKEGFLILRNVKKKKQEDDEQSEEKPGDEENLILIPSSLKVGMPLDLLDLKSEQHFTQPPPHFNEATLVKELDEKGIDVSAGPKVYRFGRG
ncbi:MAG: DNA topoisomerase, partial [Chrysiogenales bacterium]